MPTGRTGGGSIFNQATLTIQNGNAIGRAGAGNIADLIGGGIYNYLGSTMTVDASNVSANTADLHAGGIYNQATLTVQNGSTIGGVGIGNRASWDGGGIYNYDGGFAMVTGSRILDNKVTHGNGGGVYSDTDDAEATKVTGSCLVGNSATSFFNFRTAQQVGTGNWWGPRPGPIPLVRIRSVATWTIAAS